MKIVVMGGSGLIGRQLVAALRMQGHEVVAASPSSGVNAVTGDGLAQALAGAEVVVDVANAPSFEADAAMAFFQAAGRNLAAAGITAGVRHQVLLSVVGTDRMTGIAYFRAKLAQESLLQDSGIPYTIVRATQFFEFIAAIADSTSDGDSVRVSTALFQPVAAADVAAVVTAAALSAPLNGMFELGGPQRAPMDGFARKLLQAHAVPREVIADPAAGYFGAPLDDQSLTAGAQARLGPTTFDAWLARGSSAA